MLGDNKEDFIQLYNQYSPKVRGLLFRLVGESALNDVTQDTFMKAWENRHSFRGDSSVSTWLYRIAYNCAVDTLRKNSKKTAVSIASEANGYDPREQMDHKSLVEFALGQLTVEQRALVALYYLEGFTVSEISEILKIPEGTVKSRLSQARKDMTDILEWKGVENAR